MTERDTERQIETKRYGEITLKDRKTDWQKDNKKQKGGETERCGEDRRRKKE